MSVRFEDTVAAAGRHGGFILEGSPVMDERPVVVLGAGINGAALARELALSGVPVAVVDADDVACGATAWSTRLIHGGLRYLEYGEIGLVRESLAERDRLVRLAPHLVAPLPFYVPLRGRLGGLGAAAARLVGLEGLARRWRPARGRGTWTVGTGLALYDLLASDSRAPRHRTVRAGAAGLPRVDREAFTWGCIYADAQLLYPERFTIELLVDARRAAAETGVACNVFTHRRAALLPDGVLRLTGAVDQADVDLRPAALINATGAWVDRTLAAVFPWGTPDAAGRRLIGGTKGSHLLLRAPRLRTALAEHGVYAEADDGRPVFVLPFGADLVLVGTTDVPFTGDPATARADDTEIDYLLAATARLFPDVAPGPGDVQQHYCGVRPLPATGAPGGTPAAVTRRHMLVRHPRAPLPAWSIVGGKLTTCRSLAESAAQEVLATLGRPVLGSSRERPLPGACAGESRAAAVRETESLVRRAGDWGVDPAAVANKMVAVFGRRAPAAAAVIADRPGVIRGSVLPRAAVEFCVREEWARTLADVVERRLMLAFDTGLCRDTLVDVATVLAELGLVSHADVGGEAEACAGHLAARYGRRLPQGPGNEPEEKP
jgi:glycerol-3-phosphate dehydrogenase